MVGEKQDAALMVGEEQDPRSGWERRRSCAVKLLGRSSAVGLSRAAGKREQIWRRTGDGDAAAGLAARV
jgi:hypothetical protein